MKNSIVIVGLVIIAAAGLYLFLQRDATELMFEDETQVSAAVLANTEVFIERRAVLESLQIDQALFEDPRFISLRSYTQPVKQRPTGRPNPFAPAATP